MSEQTIFHVTNHHVASAGKPPEIDDADRGCYHGYFENEHGEQAIFVYDYRAGKATLHLGDAGWEEAYEVVDGTARNLVLADTEHRWLQACWAAATAFGTRPK